MQKDTPRSPFDEATGTKFSGIAYFVAVNIEVARKEKAHISFRRREIFYDQFPSVEIFMEIDKIVRPYLELPLFFDQLDISDERLIEILFL